MISRFASRAVFLVAPAVLLAYACKSDGLAPAVGPGDGGHPFVGASGACDTPWATHECSVELGRSGNVAQCARGQQTCENGYWGPCIADAALGTQSVRIPERPPLGTLGIEVVGNLAVLCSANPCDPTCSTFVDTTDGGVKTRIPDGGGVLGGGSLSGSNIPAGFQSKGSDPNHVCTPGCTTLACKLACQYDQRCSSTTVKQCQAFGNFESGACNGFDITMGVGCESADGLYRIFALCNRGTTTAPAGVKCYRFPGNSQQMPSTSPSFGSLFYTSAQTIDAGKCMTVQALSSGFSSNGSQEVWCAAPPLSVECDPYNNWSATKASPAYMCSTIQGSPAPATETRVFQATCPAGTGHSWTNFGYTTSTPTGTSVAFRFRSFPSTNGVCTPLTPITTDPPAPAATASSTQDPQVCPISGGVAGCPKPLGTYLGFPDSTYDCLQMDAQLTPNATQGPILYDWTVNFDCLANR